MVFFDQGQGKVHSRSDSGRRVNIFVTNKYWIRINVGARGAFDKNVAPIPMRRRVAAVQQARSSKEHCAGADRADSSNSSGDLSQPAHNVIVYFILLNCAPTGYEQSVDLAAHLPKSFVRGDPQAAVRKEGPLQRSADNFEGIDWGRSGILFAKHFRGTSKDLKRPDEIEDLGSRRGYEHDPARPRLDPLLIIKYAFHY
jgi:hypothetical protein